MTLTIHIEENDQRQMTLKVEVPEARVEKEMRQVARKLAKDVNVPGFRRGKAPYSVVVKRFGEEAIRGEAIEDLVQPIFDEAIDQEEIEFYGRPSFDDLIESPLAFQYTIALPPLVELGDYRAIRQDVPTIDIEETAVDELLEHIRSHHAISEEVDRPAQAGDLITISGRGELILVEEWEEEDEETSAEADDAVDAEVEEAAEIDDEEDDEEWDDEQEWDDEEEWDDDEDDILFDTESSEFVLDAEKLYLGAPFIEQVAGLSAGESKAFTITYPDDFEDEDLAGNEVEFEITVLNVKSYDLPELDDTLAQEEGFQTVDELREDIRKRMLTEAKSSNRDTLIEQMVDELLQIASIVYPPQAIDLEIDEMVAEYGEQLERNDWKLEEYLTLQAKSMDDLRDDFRDAAEKRLKRNLVLRQLLVSEQIRLTAADLDQLIEERTMAFSDNPEMRSEIAKFYQQGVGFEMISSDALIAKTAERIEAIFTGNAPDLSALDEEE